jgi:hypothetical protein
MTREAHIKHTSPSPSTSACSASLAFPGVVGGARCAASDPLWRSRVGEELPRPLPLPLPPPPRLLPVVRPRPRERGGVLGSAASDMVFQDNCGIFKVEGWKLKGAEAL